MYDTVEVAWEKIATRNNDHPLEKIGRKVFCELSQEQMIEIIAAVCKNNLSHNGRVPRLFDWRRGVVQDDAEVAPLFEVVSVPSGGVLEVSPLTGGFQCVWKKST